MMIIKC